VTNKKIKKEERMMRKTLEGGEDTVPPYLAKESKREDNLSFV